MGSSIRRIGTKLAITGGAIVAVTAITATSASAATTLYKVSVGVSSSGSAGYTAATSDVSGKQAIVFTDVRNNLGLGCQSGTASGIVYKGTDRKALKVGTIKATTWTTCAGPFGLVLAPSQVGIWNINLTGPTSSAGITQGYVSGVNARVSSSPDASQCSFTVTGSVPGQYSNTSQKLTIFADKTSTRKLVVSDVTGCFSQIQNGDQVTFAATYTVKATGGSLKIKSL